ncbi:hypothetical protein IFM89_003699 [Coptis chinensis]|uniref:DUF4283 domain-containing protein n=1 Tax=Coptis chinensis TaxID=261450 RepID=A0A835IVY8_9MAGN|nr:hypothetical protein IFM89_003699 [Coptis chinensis]
MELWYNGSAPSLEPTVAATSNMEAPGRLSFTYVKNVLQQRWKDKGHFEIIADKDLFYFKFSSSEARQAVLEEVPLWVKIHNVPKELWTDDGLGFLASKVGVPHSQDEATKLKKRIDYARQDARAVKNLGMQLRTASERQIHANRAQEGGQIERISTNTNVSYENTGRNTVIYASNGTGENESRRIWRVQNRPTSLSEVAGPSCIRNDRGEETKEHNSCPTAQDELAEIPIDAGQSELTEGRTQMTEVNIEMHDSMQMVVHEPQVEELVLVVQPNLFQLLAGGELEGESLHETEYFEDHLYAYEKEVEHSTPLAIVMPEPRMTRS